MERNKEHEENVCPKCGTPDFRLYFINYKEKVLMCGNVQCDYPFGSDDIHIVETDELGLDSDSDCDIPEDDCNPKNVVSTYPISRDTGVSKDVNKEQNTKGLVDLKEYLQSNISESPLKKKRKVETLEEKLCKTNELFNQLYEENETNVSIRNSQWIKNLLNMQATTKTKLLTSEEVCFLGIDSPSDAVVKPKLKINVDQNGDVHNVKLLFDDDHLQNNSTT